MKYGCAGGYITLQKDTRNTKNLVTSCRNYPANEFFRGRSSHTSEYKPWKLVTCLAFTDRSKAADFEQYPKSGSGRTFANIRLW
jgi:hypothetical protein